MAVSTVTSLLSLVLFGSLFLASRGFAPVATHPSSTTTTTIATWKQKGMTRKESSLNLSAQKTPSFPKDGVKGIVFDVDGTLADSWKLGFDATVVVLEKNGIPTITEEIYHDGTRYATPERLARHAGIMPGDKDFEEVGNRLGDEFDGLYVDLVNMETAGFYDGIYELLDSLPSDVRVGALTNACVKYAHAVLKTNSDASNNKSIYDMFSSIRGADNVPSPKPSPDGLYVCCKEMGVDPEKCIYVGDSPSDAGAAHAAGMPSIGVTWGSHPEESLRKAPFTRLVSTVKELQTAIMEAIEKSAVAEKN